MAKYAACIGSRQRGERVYRLPDSIRSTHSQDGGIVLDIRRGQMFKLNLVGSRVLELMKTNFHVSQIVDDVSNEFEIDRDLAEADVREFIVVLKNHGLLE